MQKRSGGAMKDGVTSILSAMERGDPRAGLTRNPAPSGDQSNGGRSVRTDAPACRRSGTVAILPGMRSISSGKTGRGHFRRESAEQDEPGEEPSSPETGPRRGTDRRTAGSRRRRRYDQIPTGRTHPPCGPGSGCPAASSRNPPFRSVLGLHLPRGFRPGGGVMRRRKDSCRRPRAE